MTVSHTVYSPIILLNIQVLLDIDRSSKATGQVRHRDIGEKPPTLVNWVPIEQRVAHFRGQWVASGTCLFGILCVELGLGRLHTGREDGGQGSSRPSGQGTCRVFTAMCCRSPCMVLHERGEFFSRNKAGVALHKTHIHAQPCAARPPSSITTPHLLKPT